MMYPWSKASMTVRPLLGLKILESRFFIPQPRCEAPRKKKPGVAIGTSTLKSLLFSPLVSLSTIVLNSFHKTFEYQRNRNRPWVFMSQTLLAGVLGTA